MRIPKKIGRFTLYKNKPNTLDRGYYYQLELNINIPNDWKKRMIRVYLPSDYDFNDSNKRFPVIYMTDGQNLCDKYLSSYGEWEMDECIERRVKDKKQSFIAVGIDCPHEEWIRVQEMLFPAELNDFASDCTRLNGEVYGEILAKIILKQVKNLIDKTFNTLKDKKNTAVGGSSMGGLMSFYMGLKYKNLIGYSLVFSPGFLCYKSNYFKNTLNKYHLNPKKYGKIFLYVGGRDYEKQFVSLTLKTYNILTKKGFNDDQLRLIYDSHNIHHESSWSMYLDQAISFWLDE